jgi:hypothetical protein
MNTKTYFGLLGIAATMLGGVILSSCNHDDNYYSEEKVEQLANDQYAAVFEKTFGKVGSNVDWGFSSKNAGTRAFTRSVGTYADYRGNIQPNITFPSDCDASNFLEEVPTSGVNRLPDNGGGPGSWYIDASTTTVQTWAGASKIYVTGTVDLSDETAELNPWKFSPSNTSEIYLVKGSKLILGEASAKNFNVAAIYIAEGATLQTNFSLWANNSTKIYNHGILKVGSFEPNTESFLYNVGTLDAGSVTAESNDSRIVNDAIINCASVTVNAGAVQNNAEWTVTGTTHINSNNSGWVNNGHWTTKDYAYIGGSENVINNCYLEVKNDFEMNISSVQGAFKIDGGGGVLTQNFYGGRDSSTGATSGPFVVEMGENAVFVVSETAMLESGRGDDEGFGFFGPSTGGYAVLQAKNIVRNPYLESINSHGAVTYGGNLYVSAETHFAQGHDSDGSGTYVPQPFIYERGSFKIENNIYADGFNAGKPSINIPETPCSPGFKGGNPLYRVIAEDLSASEAGDFDFNDVVFDVVKAENGKTTLKLICAGGVLPLRVRGANEAEGVEIHSVFGEMAPDAKGYYKMYNTGAGPTVEEKTFTVSGEYKTPEQIKNIIIEVKKNEVWMPLPANRGEAACKILVDNSFIPVREKRNIADEHQKFTNYVQGSFQDDFWWK